MCIQSTVIFLLNIMIFVVVVMDNVQRYELVICQRGVRVILSRAVSFL